MYTKEISRIVFPVVCCIHHRDRERELRHLVAHLLGWASVWTLPLISPWVTKRELRLSTRRRSSLPLFDVYISRPLQCLFCCLSLKALSAIGTLISSFALFCFFPLYEYIHADNLNKSFSFSLCAQFIQETKSDCWNYRYLVPAI